MRKRGKLNQKREVKRIRDYNRSRKQAIEPQDTNNHEYQRKKQSMRQKKNKETFFDVKGNLI